MDQTEDFGAWTAFVQGAYDIGVRDNVGWELARFYIEDEDEHGDGAKDVIAGLGKIVFNEAILTAIYQRTMFKCM